MPKVEIKRQLRLTRQEVSERLIALGNALADGSEIALNSGRDSIELAVGDSIEWELEIEMDGDENELEVESLVAADNLAAEGGPAAGSRPARQAARAAHGPGIDTLCRCRLGAVSV